MSDSTPGRKQKDGFGLVSALMGLSVLPGGKNRIHHPTVNCLVDVLTARTNGQSNAVTQGLLECIL